MPLNNKVAVVTGATGVLCSAMVEALLAAGAKVALLARRAAVAEELKVALAAKGYDQTLVVAADVLDRPALIAARETILKTWGRLDILVNGAGGNDPKGTTPAEQFTADTAREQSFFGLDLAGFEAVNRLNFMGTLLPSQVFTEAMLETGGSVVNISSVAATQPLTKVGAYAAAKAAVDNHTKWLATHLAPRNIRVNAITPGFFITSQNRYLLLEKDEVTPTARGKKVIAKTPMRRYGEAKELGGALVFLASDAASFVTGANLAVDGGFTSFAGV